MTLTASLFLLGEEIRGEDAPVTKWETGINQTAISNHCGSLAGTWTGTYRGLDTSPYCSGWYTCPSVRLIFEDAAGDGSAFLVERPAASGCYLDPNPNGCEDTSINHHQLHHQIKSPVKYTVPPPNIGGKNVNGVARHPKGPPVDGSKGFHQR